jgi:hypothetical protein
LVGWHPSLHFPYLGSWRFPLGMKIGLDSSILLPLGWCCNPDWTAGIPVSIFIPGIWDFHGYGWHTVSISLP